MTDQELIERIKKLWASDDEANKILALQLTRGQKLLNRELRAIFEAEPLLCLKQGFGEYLSKTKFLNLENGNLNELPPEIFQFKNLVHLSLHNNNIATLPAEIGQLTNLEYLCLGCNNITTLPPEIGKLTNLRIIKAYDNNITTLPPEIGQLKNLEEAVFWGNNLTGLPAEIWELSLKRLSLFDNNIVTLPSSIKSVPPFSSLDLTGNKNLDRKARVLLSMMYHSKKYGNIKY